MPTVIQFADTNTDLVGLCNTCLEEREAEEGSYSIMLDDFGEEVEGTSCEDCGANHVTLRIFEMAVEKMCKLIDGSPTSIEEGEWEDDTKTYGVEVSGNLDLPLFKSASMGGWIEVDFMREVVRCMIGIEIGGQPVGNDEAFIAAYIPDTDTWIGQWGKI